MDGILAELRKIPPVTRFICGSHVGITGLVLLNLVSPYKILYVARAVFSNFEVSGASLSIVLTMLTRTDRYGDYIRVSSWEVRQRRREHIALRIHSVSLGGGINFIFEVAML